MYYFEIKLITTLAVHLIYPTISFFFTIMRLHKTTQVHSFTMVHHHSWDIYDSVTKTQVCIFHTKSFHEFRTLWKESKQLAYQNKHSPMHKKRHLYIHVHTYTQTQMCLSLRKEIEKLTWITDQVLLMNVVCKIQEKMKRK